MHISRNRTGGMEQASTMQSGEGFKKQTAYHNTYKLLQAMICKTKEEKEALDAVFRACASKLDDEVNKNRVCTYIGMKKKYFHQNTKGSNSNVDEKYHHKKRNVSESQL
eukprot:12719477-Ditylum_brightwellii.AAC.1